MNNDIYEFDPDWPHGHVIMGRPEVESIRIICTDAVGNFPIVALLFIYGEELVYRFSRNGNSTQGMTIRNAPATKKRITGWLNVYPSLVSSHLRETKHAADRHSAPSRIACIYIDVEEGEGL